MERDPDSPHRWTPLGETIVYSSPWLALKRVDVRLPDGSIVEGHHVVEFRRPAVGVVPVGPDGRILLVRHHRFVTDSVGWEVVCGRCDDGEEPVETARREIAEEVGGRAASVREIGRFYPAAGTCRLEFVCLVAEGVVLDGAPSGAREIGPHRWFAPAEIDGLIERGEVNQGLSLAALLLFLRTDRK